jgi:parvulin-like peptidyl-prolyl isomerase
MHIGEISQPIRTRLGFHIIELTDLKPARQMSFEEARTEIRLIIENEKHRTALQDLVYDFSRRIEFVTNRL